MKKRIIFLASTDSNHVYKWVTFFSKKKYDIHVISIDKNNNLKNINNITVKIFNKYKNKYFNILSAYKYIKASNYIQKEDIVHVHYLGVYALLALLINPKKIISTVWGSDVIFNQFNLLKKIIIKKILRKSHIVTTDSLKLFKNINTIINEKKKIKIINFGVDTDFYKKISKNVNLAKKLNLKKNSFIIISLRNHYKIYDIITLLKAVKILVHKKINVKALIFGYGDLTNDLKDYTIKNSIENSVLFLGRYNAKNLPKFFSISDVYVSTSHSDAGISSSTAEAMSCEMSCIISNNSENNLWIQNGINGFLFRNKNYKELASIIQKEFINKKSTSKMGQLARKKIIEENNYKVEMMKMNKFYQEMFK